MNMSVVAKTETDTSLSNMDEFDYGSPPGPDDYDYGPTPPVVDTPDTDKPQVSDGGAGKDTGDDTKNNNNDGGGGGGGKNTNNDDKKNNDNNNNNNNNDDGKNTDTNQDQQQEESVAPIQQPIVIDQGVAIVPAAQNQPVMVVSPEENMVDQAPRPEILVVPEPDVVPVAMAPLTIPPTPSPVSPSSGVYAYGPALLSAPWNAFVVIPGVMVFMHLVF